MEKHAHNLVLFHFLNERTDDFSLGCKLWESLCNLLQEVNNKPFVLNVVSKLSAASNVSWNISCLMNTPLQFDFLAFNREK